MNNGFIIRPRTDRPTRNEMILDRIRKGTRSKTWSRGNRPADARADRRAAKRDLRREF